MAALVVSITNLTEYAIVYYIFAKFSNYMHDRCGEIMTFDVAQPLGYTSAKFRRL